ncbi:MAG: DNA-binding protein [Candidatus Aenigmatarchaeota archaeon]
MRILLDTNFLVFAAKKKVRIFSELEGELYTIDLVERELAKLAGGNGKDAAAARIALKLLKAEGIRALKAEKEEADDELARRAKAGFAVATQDRALRERIKKSGGKVIFIRQGRHAVQG